jgi:hypothetical protein
MICRFAREELGSSGANKSILKKKMSENVRSIEGGLSFGRLSTEIGY